MKSLQKVYEINAPIAKVWDALVNPKTIEIWSSSPAEMSDQEKDKFKLWGGDIYGVNTKVEKHVKLDQDWYAGNWPQPSKVSFTLNENGEDKTQLSLIHKDIPDSEFDEINKGWDEYYLGPLKELLER
jgi:activator of HSP90 ATPase